MSQPVRPGFLAGVSGRGFWTGFLDGFNQRKVETVPDGPQVACHDR